MPDKVIFDVDGTLLDSVDAHARAWQEAFARRGIEATFDAVRAQIGKGGGEFPAAFPPPDAVERDGECLLGERSRHFKNNYLPRVRPFPGVRELFQKLLADGKRVVLGSSGKRDEVAEYKRIAGIADLSEDETTSGDAERSRPHPDIFLAALEKLGNPDKRTVVVVGDTPYDAEAATEAGLRVVGVLCGGFPEANLRQAGCAAVFRDPADLLARYDEWAGG